MDTRTLLLAVSLGANLLLMVTALALVITMNAGPLLSGGSSPGSATPTVTPGTPTTTVTAGLLASGGGLQVAPASVQVGCASGMHSQYIVLQNTSASKLRWHADLSQVTEPGALAANPSTGQLYAGASIPIQIQFSTGDQQPGSGPLGIIRFAPNSSSVGSGASVSVSVVGC